MIGTLEEAAEKLGQLIDAAKHEVRDVEEKKVAYESFTESLQNKEAQLMARDKELTEREARFKEEKAYIDRFHNALKVKLEQIAHNKDLLAKIQAEIKTLEAKREEIKSLSAVAKKQEEADRERKEMLDNREAGIQMREAKLQRAIANIQLPK